MADPSFARTLQQVARRLGSAAFTLVKAEAAAAWTHVVQGTFAGRARMPAEATAGSGPPVERQAREEQTSSLVDLNSASEAELQTLPGIGPARAQAIVAGRPYASEEDLIERGMIPASVFDAIEGRICARRAAPPPRRQDSSPSSPPA